jgi:predicted dehydrogenase
MHKIQPVILGSGTSGQAINKSLAIIGLNTEYAKMFQLLPAIFASRNQSLQSYLSTNAKTVLFIANPSGLHAKAILVAEKSKFDAVVCDKPVCVTTTELAQLKKVSIPVAVLHGYRAMWGPRTIHQMITAGELGELISIEHRYWQSSVARCAVGETPTKTTWKDNPKLSGPFDAFVDLATHSVDMVLYLMQAPLEKTRVTLSYANSLYKHRDTHLHLNLLFAGGRLAQLSVSKTMHGATNDFEVTVLGSKASATWRFLNTDEIVIGRGSKVTILRRSQPNCASGGQPFHGMGWLEGYIEIISQSLKSVVGLKATPAQTLPEGLQVMNCILNASHQTK